MLSSIERVLICRSVQLFSGLDDEHLVGLVAAMSERECEAGATLMSEGDRGRSIFVIVRGEVEVLRDGVRLASLGERDVVGELAAFDPGPRSATVRAIRDTHLLELDNEHLEALMMTDIDLLRAVIRVLCRRLRASAAYATDR